MILSALILGLTVGFASITPGAAVNANTNPIVATVDPAQVTNTLTLTANGMTAAFGTDANAGGYWNSLSLSGFGHASLENKELNQYGCGRGGQLAEFDRSHNNDFYNPTQAGSGLALCAAITMTQTTRKLCTGQFQMPLFQAAGNTFTNYRSEQDLMLCYIDRSAYFGVPAVQIDYLLAYVHQPDAIHQFDYIYDPAFAVVGIDGTQQGKSNDLNRQQAIWGMRLNLADFPYVMWQSSGVWSNHLLDGTNYDCETSTNNTSYVYANGQIVRQNGVSTCGGVDNDTQCLTAGTNSATDMAACIYWPMSGVDSVNNISQTYTVRGTTGTAHNWHVQSRFRSDDAGSGIADFKFIHSLSGALKPDDWQATAGRGFVLFCANAAQCATAVAAWKAASHTGDETP
jgi:hypothetical protein